MSSLQKSIMKSRLPPIPSASKISKLDGSRRGFQKNYSPKQWHEYFKEREMVSVDENKFCVYRSAEPAQKGPLIVLLHGGGFSALTWALFSTEITSMIHCQCLAMDLRGHGDTETTDDWDLSATTLATDVARVLSILYPEDNPAVILVGHSMGGAIAAHLVHLDLVKNLIGLTVIDVVEGTAMDALASMQSFLRSRPTYFKSIPQAIEWSVRSGQIRNLESAKVSMPGQIMNTETLKLSTNELPLPDAGEPAPAISTFANPLSIAEDPETEGQDAPQAPVFKQPQLEMANAKKYTWRIDLSKSEKFWAGWFEGLSQKFLDLPVAKLLLLASIDGLDRTLTVGQMQGKFQMQVLARCGHAVHEDRPCEVAEVIASYMIRNEFAEACGDFVRHMPAC
ncbi:protein phosphatase methylesterase 1 [Phlebotomus argentipes]|uniref:protein phosphatase methylesterase 1 n=1 Tax=Phlebotomus argentipes TaxID=94469 RepID=UPI002892FA45|nr:protein phosphatase methylesterase 1 [Phlebotomus argentipes]